MPRRVIRGFLRSDGKPRFRTQIYEAEGEVVELMSENFVYTTPTEPLLNAAGKIGESGHRTLPVVVSGWRLVGVFSSMDLVNYFSSPDYMRLINFRHKGNLFSALREPVETVMTRGVVAASLGDSITDLLVKMARNNVGVLPVVDGENRVHGVVTERDVLDRLLPHLPDVPVSEFMSREVVSVGYSASLSEALKKMVESGYRRIAVMEDGRLLGVFSSIVFAKLLGSGNVFTIAPSALVKELLETRVGDLMDHNVVVTTPEEGSRKVFSLMVETGRDIVFVTEEGVVKGVVTERDLLNLALFESDLLNP